ncbi:MAG: methylaspartate mutase [Candidatus Cloacimonetes bacterium 4572_55]|nr:MAG: methylaspartate mutase [Candidatus Cloacimonetes bacterium 4572_55]
MAKKKELRRIIATDCGSTTTKAIMIEKIGGEYRQTTRGEAPTTVEAPFEDVTKGGLNSIIELEELRGCQLIDGNDIIRPFDGKDGADIYISTSSAGGGLQMMVGGAVKAMTGESAERCALGAGAIVMDVLAANDRRLPHERIDRIRQLRPDMMLLSGGTDGGTITHVAELAEQIAAADPKPRLGIQYKLPVIYAGNKDARSTIKEILGEKSALDITENIRPSLEEENLQPARAKIQDLFEEHVMAHAPGYPKLMKLVDVPIMPTPAAVGEIMKTIAKEEKINIVGVDIGGATTDVFSVFGEIFNRSVSANLGMSYSISNVFAEAGLDNVMRWVPFGMDELDLRNRIKNKMIRPTTIPQSLAELMVEQAVAREALRLAFEQHKLLAVGLKGIQQERTISDTFDQSATGKTLINMLELDLIVGSGGVLSHAPRRSQSAQMIIDSFLPEGITQLAVDSIFMMPHLGVLSTIDKKAATEVFEKDCMVRLGTCVAPLGDSKKSVKCFDIKIDMPDGSIKNESVMYGEYRMIKMPVGEKALCTVTPTKNFDMGQGRGKPIEGMLHGGIVGIFFDARGRRPFKIPSKKDERLRKLIEWLKVADVYPRYAV